MFWFKAKKMHTNPLMKLIIKWLCVELNLTLEVGERRKEYSSVGQLPLLWVARYVYTWSMSVSLSGYISSMRMETVSVMFFIVVAPRTSSCLELSWCSVNKYCKVIFWNWWSCHLQRFLPVVRFPLIKYSSAFENLNFELCKVIPESILRKKF